MTGIKNQALILAHRFHVFVVAGNWLVQTFANRLIGEICAYSDTSETESLRSDSFVSLLARTF